ncbi:hypothetical protein [Legionella bononiensis]|nr:hypothetical protein [Legionella bononiensis]
MTPARDFALASRHFKSLFQENYAKNLDIRETEFKTGDMSLINN